MYKVKERKKMKYKSKSWMNESLSSVCLCDDGERMYLPTQQQENIGTSMGTSLSLSVNERERESAMYGN